MDTLCEANLRQSRDLFSLFQNIPVFGEHLYYADVITAIASFSDSIFFFFCRNCKNFNYRWSFLIHESCIALKSCSVEKNGSFRYLLPKLSNCFHVYSFHFKQTVRNQSFNDYRSFDDFSFTTWYKIKCHLPSFLDIFINWISVIWDNKHIPLFNK